MYTKEVMRHFTNPKNAGKIDDADGVGVAGNVKCGDVLKVYIKVKSGKIMKAKFETYGCVAAIAASDILCDIVRGMKVGDALKLTNKDIIKPLGDLPPVKVHCSVLGSSALKKAIEDYQQRQKKNAA